MLLKAILHRWSSIRGKHSTYRMEFRTGDLAQLTDGSVLLTLCDNAVLATVVNKLPQTSLENTVATASKQQSGGQTQAPTHHYSFPTSGSSSGLHLSVDFRQSAAALGRIPMNYFRRELSQSDSDVLTSRIIDRSLRPAFFQNYPGQIHIVCKPLAIDDTGDSVVMGVNVASAALAISSVPLRCSIAACRVGLINAEDDQQNSLSSDGISSNSAPSTTSPLPKVTDPAGVTSLNASKTEEKKHQEKSEETTPPPEMRIVVNPPRELLKRTVMNMVLAGTGDGRVMMIEMDGKEIGLDLFMECVNRGMAEIKKVSMDICRLVDTVGKPKIQFVGPEYDQNLMDLATKSCAPELERILTDYTLDKIQRDNAIFGLRDNWAKHIIAEYNSKNNKAVDDGTQSFSECLPSQRQKLKLHPADSPLKQPSTEEPSIQQDHSHQMQNQSIAGDSSPPPLPVVRAHFSQCLKSLFARLYLRVRVRCDGRAPDEFRPIKIDVDVFKKLHGSSMFRRGQSQVFATVTFDSPSAAFHSDAIAQFLGAQRKKSFMLHYEFPQFAVNELGADATGGGVGLRRREIGHGLLAEKAVKHVIPTEFPYTIQLACQVLESNGSTSMASVCAGSLALMDSGVPLSGHVAGLAMGLITDPNEEDPFSITTTTHCQQQGQPTTAPLQSESPSAPTKRNKKYMLLTDLMGMEDHLGQMDFKVSGTSRGFTAMQLDIKVCGLPIQVVREALVRARLGLDFLLKRMNSAICAARSEYKSSVPVIELISPPAFQRAILFRSGAYNAKLVEAETGVKVASEDERTVSLMAPNQERLDDAKQIIARMFEEASDENYTFGAIYRAEIVRILETGVMVVLREGGRPILVRNLDLSPLRKNASGLGLEIGHRITVQYFGRDSHSGFHRVSARVLHAVGEDMPVQNMLPRTRPVSQPTSLPQRPISQQLNLDNETTSPKPSPQQNNHPIHEREQRQ